MRTLLLLGVLFVGCGPAHSTWKVGCMNVEVPEDLIEAGHQINYGNLENSAKLAQELLDRRYGDGEFCKRAETITVRMMPKAWDCLGSPTGCQGEFIPMIGLVKVITGSALLHEFIHVEETHLGISGTITHKDWDRNGQYLLAEEYERQTKPWWD